MKKLWQKLFFALGLLLSVSGAAIADVVTLEVGALIDGRDQLIIQGDTLQWHHMDAAAVGRHDNLNEPTVITTTLNGIAQMESFHWIPDWPLPWPDEIRFQAFSSVFEGLVPEIPKQDLVVTLEVIEARSVLQLVQQPSEINGYTTILEFDDIWESSHAYYTARLTFQWETKLRMIHLGQNLVLSWPAAAAGYQLETTPTLDPEAVWAEVSTPPVVVGNEHVVTVSYGEGAQFFRLSMR